MKKQRKALLILLAALLSNGLFLGCQPEEPTAVPDQKTAKDAQTGPHARVTIVNDKVWNLAANFYEELPEDQLDLLVKNFYQLSAAELDLFFQYRTELEITEVDTKSKTDFAALSAAELEQTKGLLVYAGQQRAAVLASSLKMYNRPITQLSLEEFEKVASLLDSDAKLEQLSNLYAKVSAANVSSGPVTNASCRVAAFPYVSTKGSSRGGSYWYAHERIATTRNPNDCDHGYLFARNVGNFYPRNGASVTICQYYKNRLGRRSFRDSPTPTIHQEIVIGNRAINLFLFGWWSRFKITVGQIV